MKNIVNPVPEIFTDALPTPTRNDNGEITAWSNIPEGNASIRRGVGYDYDDERNKFIIDMIHTSVLGGYGHLNIGQRVLNSITGYGLTGQNRFLFLEDALAYAALYPQNAKVSLSTTAPPNPQNPRLNGKSWALKFVGKKEQQDMLTVITNAINMQNTAFDTVTTEAAQRPENQKTINDPSGPTTSKAKHTVVKGDWLSKIAIRYGVKLEDILALDENAQFRANPDLIEPGDVVTLPFNEANSRLPEIVPALSSNKVKQLLEAGGQPGDTIPSGLSIVKKELDDEKRKVDPNMDLDDWTRNVPSDTGTKNEQLGVSNEISVNLNSYTDKDLLSKVYYNTRDKHYWCAFRTLAKNPKSFDLAGGDQSTQNISNFKSGIAVPEILKFADRDNEQNRGEVELRKVEFFSFYGSPNRPLPGPAGQSFWILAARIPEDEIEKLSKQGGRSKSDDVPSPAQRAKELLAEAGKPGAEGLRRAPYLVSDMRLKLNLVSQVLKDYYSQLNEQGIHPSMMDGVNLEITADDVKSFNATLQRWIEDNNIEVTVKDKIEFVFDAEYKLVSVLYNGRQYAGESDPKTGLITQFGATSRRVFALIFHANAISEFYTKEGPPAIEFVQKYIYPSPVIKPSEIKNKQEENKKSKKYPEETGGSALGKNTFDVNPKKKKKKAKAKTKAEVEREFQRRFQMGNEALGFFTSTLNNAGCETPLAKYLNDAFLIYQLFGGKASFTQIVGVVVKILRDEVIELKKNEQLLLQGAGYLDDPDQVIRDIETEINRQFFACFRVLGELLAKEVLDPGGVPPDVQNLIKAGLTPPRGITLTKTPTADLWKLWREQLYRLIIEFIKQLILQALRDLLLAVSGCGPETVVGPSNLTKNRVRGVNSPYGVVRINDLVDYANIDLLEVARDLRIEDTVLVGSPEGERFQKQPPTVEQLRQLNDDCSDLMVDTDVVAVLQGSGGQALIDSLYRGINLGTLRITELSDTDRENILDDKYSDELTRYLLNSIQESVYPGDVRYATLNFSKDLIVRYFKRLGQVLGPEITLGLEKPLDTKEAYCDSRDVLAYGIGASLDIGLEDIADLGDDDDTPVAGGLTRRQLRSQIGQQIEQNSIKIGLLCEMSLDFNFDFAFEIQNFWDSLGLAQWFLDLLAFLRMASQKAQGIQAKAITAGMRARAADEITTDSLAAAGVDARYQLSQLYRFYERYFGDNYGAIVHNGETVRAAKTKQYVVPTSIKYNVNQVADIPGNHPHYDIGYQDTGIGRNAVPPNDRSFGRLQLDYIPRNNEPVGTVRVYYNRSIRTVIGSGQEARVGYKAEPFEILCEFELEPAVASLSDPEAGSGANANKYKTSFHLARSANVLKGSQQLRQNQSTRINRNHSNLMHIGFGKTVGNKDSKGGTGGRIVANDVASIFSGYTPEGNVIDGLAVMQIPVPYLNTMSNVTRTVTLSLYANENVKNRVDGTIETAAVPPFAPNGDPCNYGPDEQVALTVLNAIHQRIFNFVLNVAPLFNNGYALETPDTINMISTYLQNKVITDFQGRGIFGYLVQGMEFVVRTCSRTDVDESGVEFNPALISDPEDQIKYTVKQMLRQVFYEMSTGAAQDDNPEFNGWGAMTRNVFKDIEDEAKIRNERGQDALNRKLTYDMLIRYMYTGNTFGTFGNSNLSFDGFREGYLEEPGGLSERLGFSDSFETFKNEQFLAAVPIPLLVGLQYLFYDKVVAITDKFPQMAFYAQNRIETADQALKTAVDPASTQNYPILQLNPGQPKSLEELILDDERAEARVQQLLNVFRGPDVGELGDRQRENERQVGLIAGGLGVVPEDERRPNPFPVEFGGRTYNNRRDLTRDQAKYQALWETCNSIRSQKTALETRLGMFATHVARSEQLYRTTGFNFGGKSDNYDDFIRTGSGQTAYRGKIHEIVQLLNRYSSLGITQYGANSSNGHARGQGRAYNKDRDLKVQNKDSITQSDFTLSRNYHSSPPFTKQQAFGMQKLGALEALMEQGMISTWAGLRDTRERTAFYTEIVRAAEDFTGFSRLPPARYDDGSNYSLERIDVRSARGNTVTGILANITKLVAELDESALFRDLGITTWDRDQRNRVEGILTEMRNFIDGLEGD